ncbi:hypothetical protein QHI69_19510 [Burkholderia gladioli pv. gladioli]|uniref:Uncharacterized protein n=1 Tax=Burkholderia gladioli TaxID=28095 RepID=A0A095HD67_BURGA|nr:hypothetical protein [Burkholderia gladioli]ASD79830.1 hypothetical protein CEJ98_13005 [Burkholderia gladioli pv. gladioli]AWY56907.1 hypothetical protein A8H28_28115 [Burkholderia gladioli pv. gladioli]KGC11499.1 hypothetical protein DM48_7531 [Burkholderia gladioli]MDJ1164082.1 hypothetical protein [Burkholderia gladioli pv. gladioli]PEH40232.1 hypothetical protein CRM94_26155 [Burkholderia gladioli]
MPVARVYTKSQWDAFARTLDALPEKPQAERGLSVREAMREVRAPIRHAQGKGYTLEQIAEQAKRAGLDITAGTIRYALRSEGKGSRAGKGNSAGNTARRATGAPPTGTATAPPRVHGVAHGGVSHANSPRNEGRTEGRTEGRNEARPHGGKAEVKPQPMPVQGSLGFTIKPDTDDL